MVTVDLIYKIKYTISEMLLNNPILASDLIDRVYVIAMEEAGLNYWKYIADNRTTGIQIHIAYDHIVKKSILDHINNEMITYFEGMIRNPANHGLLTQLGVAYNIDIIDELTLRDGINAAITHLDFSNTEKSSFVIKIA